jgi:PKD repeat protein
MNQTINLSYTETPTTESSVKLSIINGKIYKEYYAQRKFQSKHEIDRLIEHLVIDLNFTMNKQDSSCVEFVDSKTGNIRYVFWINNSVENYYKEYLGNVKPDTSLLTFNGTPYTYFS